MNATEFLIASLFAVAAILAVFSQNKVRRHFVCFGFNVEIEIVELKSGSPLIALA